MRLGELKKILDGMIKKAKWGFEEDEWYKPLWRLKVICEGEYILDDPYYDAQAIAFARKLLDLIDEGDGT